MPFFVQQSLLWRWESLARAPLLGGCGGVDRGQAEEAGRGGADGRGGSVRPVSTPVEPEVSSWLP
jgi:hypothetical protein